MPRTDLLLRLWKRAGDAAALLLTLWKLVRHPRTPTPARLVALLLLVYAVSPVDLLPDVIPLLGLVDEIVLIPLGAGLVQRLLPAGQWAARAAEAARDAPRLRRWLAVGALLLVLWIALLIGGLLWLLGR